jgi:hypothetical protein
MRYEVWEYEYGVSYALCPVGDAGERARAEQEGGRHVLTIEADSWEEAKRKQNEHVSGIRRAMMDR